MTNEFNLKEYIKDLSPELQEKARACKTKDELLQLAADEDIEVPMDALESVAGGCTSTKPQPDKCNKCNAKVTPCTDNDSHECFMYDANRWKNNMPMGGGMIYVDISAHFRCPNCGIVYKDEIHA